MGKLFNKDNNGPAEIQRLTGIPMPEQVLKLRDLPVRHTAECDRDKMGQAVLDVMA